MTKYLEYIEQPTPNTKTKRWLVHNKVTKENIGIIRWYGGWRQYVLFPLSDTYWAKGCLEEVSEFIKKEMEKRRKKGK